ERRKDQIARLPWVIRPKHDGSLRRPKASELSPKMRTTIRDVERLFKNPDYDIGFRPWIRSLVEDILVIDAPTLFCQRNRCGQLGGLTQLEGTTIKRVINEWGQTSRPWVWDGKPFQWLGQTIDQSNIADRGFKTIDGWLYPPAFQQVLKGLPAVDYTTRD